MDPTSVAQALSGGMPGVPASATPTGAPAPTPQQLLTISNLMGQQGMGRQVNPMAMQNPLAMQQGMGVGQPGMPPQSPQTPQMVTPGM